MATTPARPETTEYVPAAHQLTQDIIEVYSSIMLEPANGSKKTRGLDAKLNEFQTRFQVMLKVIVGDPLTPSNSFSLDFHCPSSQSRRHRFRSQAC